MQQQNSAGLIVTILTTEVKGGEPTPVLHVHVRLGPAQGGHGLAEPLPGGLVQGRVAVQLVLVVEAGSLSQQ